MQTRVWNINRGTALAAALLVALGISQTPNTALAQEKASISKNESTTEKVTIKSVDRATRHLVVSSASGETFSIKAPPEAHNFDQLKPGDTISVTYTRETEFVLSAPNAALPKDQVNLLEARAAKGERPGGLVASHVVVSGSVVAIDIANHRLKLASPQGGEVHSIDVKTPEGRRAMTDIKVGDTITAYVTESLLLDVNPA